MKYIYIVYQYLIAIPIFAVLTFLTALTTIIAIPWKNSWWLHAVQAGWARSFCYLLFIPVRITGTEHIRPNQSYVFVSNHQSFFDVFAIYGWLPVIFKWLMKAELGKIPVVGAACRAAGHITINRSNTKAAMESLHRIEQELVGGVSTVIFPEGTRTKTGQVGPFKRGAFQVAMDLNLPIIPITLDGCYEVMNYKARHVSRHPIHIHVGEEIHLDEITEGTPMEYVRARVEEQLNCESR